MHSICKPKTSANGTNRMARYKQIDTCPRASLSIMQLSFCPSMRTTGQRLHSHFRSKPSGFY
jgi:hypothetical protein